MKVGTFNRLSRDSIVGGANLPDWMDPFLAALNSLLEPMNIALTGKLSFADNFFAFSTTQTFTHGVELVLNPPNQTARVVGMIPVFAANYALISSYGFSVKQNGGVGITLYFANQADNSAAAAGTKVQCTVILLYG